MRTINIGTIKNYLNKHNIRLGRIYFHLMLLIRCFMLTAEY